MAIFTSVKTRRGHMHKKGGGGGRAAVCTRAEGGIKESNKEKDVASEICSIGRETINRGDGSCTGEPGAPGGKRGRCI